MPIPVVCPSCSANLNAPDNLAGKTVKCPKCQDPVTVKAAGPPPLPRPPQGEEARPRPKRSPPADNDEPVRSRGRRPVPRDEADDAESDYDDRPRGQRRKKSSLPLVLALVAVGFFALAGLGTLGYLFLARAAPGVVAPPAAGGAGPGGEAVAVAGPKWVPVEDAEFAFTAAFPNEQPTPFDPLAEITDPQQRDFAEAAMKNMRAKYLNVTDGGRRYLLTAMPMQLGGMPGRVYLGRVSGSLSLMHPGYTPEPGPEGESAGHPCQDFTLKREGKTKVLRIVVAPGLIYQLMVEGGADLTLADPTAMAFFQKFVSTRPAAPVAKPKPKPKEPDPKSKESPPATAVGDWMPFAGEKVKYDLSFPGGAPTEVGTFDRVADPTTRKFMETTWARDQVTYETFETSQNGLRFVITAFYDQKLVRIAAANAQAARIKMLRDAIYEKALPRTLRSARGNTLNDESVALALKSGKVIARQVRVGSYSYFLRVEGPPTMHDDDATVWRFLESLKWPEDAVPKKK